MGDAATELGLRPLVAPDSFKGTMDATTVAAAIVAGLRRECMVCPVADGGEGTIAALVSGYARAEVELVRVTGPLGEPVDVELALLQDGSTAVVEVAQACGLVAIPDPGPETVRAATTRGVGELIAVAAERGARRVLVGCGGSAGVDGGAGALEAFDPGAIDVVCLADTTEPWERAARVFGPQKGADDATVAELADRLDALADTLPRDPRGVEMTGAGGGLSGGLWAHGAALKPGAAAILARAGFDAMLEDASFVVTGEGCLDATTLSGKAVFEVATKARQRGVPCHAIVGRLELDAFSVRLMDLASVAEAGDPDAIASAAAAILAPVE